ncbi:unnamed protein product [Mytilus edulis]|uniref:Core-binding (CB) domain-containing protein n=1 Tax=Mytilus edulis TaxID=6550 RepID=A0A8S3UQU8_MYTED|nr:unnamed protein product [Mytilus edulis]
MLRRGTRKRTASARAGVRRTPVVSKGVSSRASVQSSMTVTRPEAIYTTSGHDGAAIPTTATVSTTRMLMPTFSSNQDNSVHIPDMLPWQPRRAIDLQPTVDNTQFVSQTVEEIPGTSTRGRVGSRKQPRRVQRFDIESETNRLINCSLAPNTIQAYQRALNALAKFRDSFDLDHSFPIPLNHITQFIAYMSCLDMAPSTVKCYISAISFYNKINNYEDMSQLFVVRKMIDGMARSKLKRPDSQEVSVWIVGSSLIRNAFVHARSRTGGVNLGLHRIGVKIWWQGYGGMGLKDLESTIKRLMKYEKAPKYLVLHIAGNDLLKTKLGFLRNEIKTTLEKVQSYLPNSSIVWSQILPRTNWRHSISQDSMMACRIRINSAIASFVLKNGGHYIKYPDILPNSTFLKEDGVHLTDLGNDIFLNNLQGALEMFICSGSYTYPDTFGTSMCIS